MKTKQEAFKSQDTELVNTLITISESSSRIREIPNYDGTVKSLLFEILSQNPYKFTQSEVFYELHIVKRGKNELKIETYKLQRSELCKSLGWGIHGDAIGKLSLVPADSLRYKELLENRGITKKNAYNLNKSS